MRLSLYDFKVEYRPGEFNANADELSRQAWDSEENGHNSIPLGVSPDPRFRLHVGMEKRERQGDNQGHQKGDQKTEEKREGEKERRLSASQRE